MKSFGLFIIVLFAVLVAGCATVDQSRIVVDTDDAFGITKYFHTSAGEFVACQTWGKFATVANTVSSDGRFYTTNPPVCNYTRNGGGVTTILITPTGRIIGGDDRTEVGNFGFGFIQDVLSTPDGKTYVVGGMIGTMVWKYHDDRITPVYETERMARKLVRHVFHMVPYGGDDVFAGLLVWTSDGWKEVLYKGPKRNSAETGYYLDGGRVIKILHYTWEDDEIPQVTYFDTETLQFNEVSGEP